PPGPQGEGLTPQQPANPGVAGPAGVSSPQGPRGADGIEDVRQVDAAAVAAVTPVAQLQMALRQASLRFALAGDGREDRAERGEIANMLTYVMTLAEARRSEPQFDAVWMAASALLFLMTRGMDFQGHPENYAPRLDFTTYQANLDRFVQSFKDVREDYRQYFAANTSREQKLASLRALADRAKQSIEQIDQQLATALDTATELTRLVEVRQEQCRQQLSRWREALARFERQLAERAGELGCPLDSLDLMVKGLDVLTKTGNTRVQKAALGAHGVRSLIDSVVPADLKPAAIRLSIRQLDALNGGAGRAAAAFIQNREMMLDESDPNAWKLLGTQQELDEIVAPYLDRLGSARELQTAMKDYVALVQSRNEVILQFNEQIAGIAAAKARRTQASEQIASAERLSSGSNPLLPELATFASNVFQATKQLCVEQLYLTWKAAVFYSLDRNLNVFNTIRELGAKTDLDWSAFENGRNAVVKHLQSADEKFSRDRQEFPENRQARGIVVTFDDAATLQTLRETNRLVVRIPPALPETSIDDNPFAGRADVRIRSALVRIEGAKTRDGELAVYLTHSGGETIVDMAGRPLDFVHSEIKTLLQYNYETGVVSAGGTITLPGSRYAAVGPFAEWRIVVDPALNRSLDLSGVTAVVLEFQITHRTFTNRGFFYAEGSSGAEATA
nr:hypothetical protein [Acidobacteriota bacterium]